MTAPLFVDCYNRMPCCDSWAKTGGCQHEPEFMSQYCQASCNACTPSYNTTDACTDRHVNCLAWKADKMCTGKSADFMSENCRHSCGKCELARDSQCFKDGKIIAIPVSQNLRKSISDSLLSEVTNRIKKVKVSAKQEIDATKKVRHG